METVATDAQVDRHPMTRDLALSWAEVGILADAVANRNFRRLSDDGHPGVFGVPTGGSVLAALLCGRHGYTQLNEPVDGCLVVDDLVDSGRTLEPFHRRGLHCDALFRKPHSPAHLASAAATTSGWVRFPWEHESGVEDAVVRLLQYIGEDPTRNGLEKTPSRVARMWREVTVGYQQDPAKILATVFDETSDEIVMLRGVEFHSTCEHHLLPFYGTVAVGYVPDRRVVGLSKLARLVECFSRRLQVQERMTAQIARAVQDHLAPLGVGVVVKARHSCMGCRGVGKPDADMVTSSMLGCLREDAKARAEFLTLLTV